jgi:hypothetical protein
MDNVRNCNSAHYTAQSPKYCNVGRVCDLGLSTLIYSRQIKSVTEVCTYSHTHTHTHTLCPPSLSGPSSSALFTLFAYTSARSTPLDTRWLLLSPRSTTRCLTRSRPVLSQRHTRPLVGSTLSALPHGVRSVLERVLRRIRM